MLLMYLRNKANGNMFVYEKKFYFCTTGMYLLENFFRVP